MRHRTGILGATALAALLFVVVAGVAAPAYAITRVEAIDRGKVWVDRRVPYSQSRYATVSGSLLATSAAIARTMGYRTDCSGFVSMSFGFRTSTGAPYSADTALLGRWLVKISKSDLRPGDVILRPKDLKIGGKTVPYGHAVIFGGWTDATRTHYYGLHQSSGAKKTVMAKIRWGLSGFGDAPGFAPYRYPGVRERHRAPRTFR